jgi:hypothetical protein
MRWDERMGRAAGWLLAPVTGTLSLIRRARMFHPEGALLEARIDAIPGRLEQLGRRLQGPALARLSTAWWKGGKEWIDALGVALRIDGQDLLFATIRFPWTTLLAPITTEQHDFLANDYFAVSPFDIAGVGRGKLRLVGSRPRHLTGSRDERLDEAVERGEASLRLEVKLEGSSSWEPAARIRLVRRVQLDDQQLRFSPFRDGKGLTPRGFVHQLRRATYLLSQLARPAASQD